MEDVSDSSEPAIVAPATKQPPAKARSTAAVTTSTAVASTTAATAASAARGRGRQSSGNKATRVGDASSGSRARNFFVARARACFSRVLRAQFALVCAFCVRVTESMRLPASFSCACTSRLALLTAGSSKSGSGRAFARSGAVPVDLTEEPVKQPDHNS